MKNSIPFCKPSIGDDEIKEVIDTLKSGWLTMGPKTIKFEQLLADYLGVKNVITVSSCTAALHLSLIALGIGSGDKVITTPYTFASTGNVILQVGAKPVFVDIETETYNIDPEKIKEAITPKTKAIIPVHFAGHPCEMNAIMEIANDHHLYVIEDAAHALGAEYNSKKIGTIGHLGCFSFYPTKNITTGEGGAISVNNDDELVDKLRILRLHGISKDAWKRYSEKGDWYYEIEECGWKYNMTDIQASLGIHQLKKLDKFIEARRNYANIYNKELGKIKGIVTPKEKNNVKHTYHLYPILLEDYNRNIFIEKMQKNGIGCSVHFIPLHLHPLYRKILGLRKGDFPNAEWIYEREVSLPIYPKMALEDIFKVVNTCKNIILNK